jgi:Domain of unknown function (DUF4145)
VVGCTGTLEGCVRLRFQCLPTECYNLPVKCAHCMVEFHDHPQSLYVGSDSDGEWGLVKRTCPACKRFMLNLQNGSKALFDASTPKRFMGIHSLTSDRLVRPKGSSRPPCPPEVPSAMSSDYLEACNVLPDSAKAAAALGRRCLQNLLRDTVKVGPADLFKEIQQVLDSGKLPSSLHDSIDAVRNIGNFAAHPMKSTQTGMILDVEPGEAEWTLDVLEELFDFYFVLPAVIQRKKDAFNLKLQEAGKPPIK